MNNSILESEQLNQFAAALAKAQGEITSAKHDKVNPHFKSSYASLNSCWDCCRDPLSKNGLMLTQQIYVENEVYHLKSTLMHSSGQFMRSIIPLVSIKSTPQQLGGNLTYMRRYAMTSLIGITAEEDDDGNSAEQYHHESKKESSKKEIVKKEAPKPEMPLEGFSQFCSKHELVRPGSDAPLSRKLEYIITICSKSKKSEIEIINSALQNETVFLEKFTQWEKENYPEQGVETPSSMDELLN